MAQKTIGELELKASILTTDNVVVDDGTNSYKATIAQLATAVLPAQTSNNFKILQTNGSTTFWGDLNTGALCSTAGATAAKTVDFTNFVLSNFCKISVKFSNANTADSPTLNVNGTGAKAIKINNSTSTKIYFPANTIIDFIYDGSEWIMENKIVESYRNGDTWYRVWSDGWIEQGGYNGGVGGASQTVTFPKAFATACVSLIYTEYDGTLNKLHPEWWRVPTALSTTGFQVREIDGYVAGYWVARGY